MRPVLSTVRDTVRTQLWPLPIVAVVLAVLAGIFVPQFDGYADGHVPSWLNSILFGGDAGAASTLLDAISSSLITVTSLTFSLTVVTLQLASSQFSPRLLRTFTSDVFVQATLAVFLATFTFSLTVLRAVRSGDNNSTPFVPRIAVTFAFVLAVASVVGLVLFLAHLARQIRVETMLRDVHEDASATATAVTTSRADADTGAAQPDAPDDAIVVTAPSSGFLTSVDTEQLCSATSTADAFLRIDRYPGSAIVEGVPIGFAWARQGQLSDEDVDCLQTAVRGGIRVGYERTAAQDIGYGLRQLTDVVNKALSPGINDPTTAVHALGHTSALLCELAARDLGPALVRDDEERPRVPLRRPTLAELLDETMTQPRRYGRSDPLVMRRLFEVLEELAWHVGDDASRQAVRDQLARLRATGDNSDFDEAENAQLDRTARRVEYALVHEVDRSIP